MRGPGAGSDPARRHERGLDGRARPKRCERPKRARSRPRPRRRRASGPTGRPTWRGPVTAHIFAEKTPCLCLLVCYHFYYSCESILSHLGPYFYHYLPLSPPATLKRSSAGQRNRPATDEGDAHGSEGDHGAPAGGCGTTAGEGSPSALVDQALKAEPHDDISDA